MVHRHLLRAEQTGDFWLSSLSILAIFEVPKCSNYPFQFPSQKSWRFHQGHFCPSARSTQPLPEQKGHSHWLFSSSGIRSSWAFAKAQARVISRGNVYPGRHCVSRDGHEVILAAFPPAIYTCFCLNLGYINPHLPSETEMNF